MQTASAVFLSPTAYPRTCNCVWFICSAREKRKMEEDVAKVQRLGEAVDRFC